MHDHAHAHEPRWAQRFLRLNDVGRLESQVSETGLSRLLALRGDEDLLDLGSGTGFYTDRMAALTSGLVYAVEIVPEMNTHYRERGLPANVRLVPGDMTDLYPSAATQTATPAPALLEPLCADVATTIATWHEIDGKLDVAGVANALRPAGRLLVVDWHKNPASWDYGPPEDVRYSPDEVAETLASHFTVISVENVGPSMFALAARRN